MLVETYKFGSDFKISNTINTNRFLYVYSLVPFALVVTSYKKLTACLQNFAQILTQYYFAFGSLSIKQHS